ncbi:MAG: PAS domain S-box protein [Candidatus Aminicenantia bacterium]
MLENFKREEIFNVYFEKTGIGYYIALSKVPIPTNLLEDEQIKLIYENFYVADCNDSFARFYGYMKAEEIIGKKIIELRGGADISENIEAHRSFIRNGYKILNAETYELDKYGKRKWFLNNAVGVIKDGALLATIEVQEDITQMKLSWLTLKSLAEERSILDNVPDLITFQDKELKVVWANKSAGDSVGLKRESLIGKHCYEIWHQRDRACENCPVESAIKTGEFHEEEIKSPDGRVWFIRGYPVRSEEGEILGVLEITTEITEKKRIEEELKLKNKYFEGLFESSPLAIAIVGKNGRIIQVNKGFEELFGWRRDEVRGVLLDEILIEPERRIEAESISERVIKGEKIFYEGTRVRKDGSKINVLIIGHPLIAKGDVIGHIAMYMDISERKRIERDLKKRDEILTAIHFSAQHFLSSADFDESFKITLELLGKATGVSRAYIFENHRDEHGRLLTSQRYEWVAEGIEPQIDNPMLKNFSWMDMGFERQVEIFMRNEPVYGIVRDFPEDERKILESQGILSILVVPIFVDHDWWGFIGFDDCVSERKWSPLEIETLKLAARLIEGALKRKDIEESLLHEKNYFEGLFEETPEAIVISDRDGRIWRVNRGFERLFGYSNEEVKGKLVDDVVIKPEKRGEAETLTMRVMKGEKIFKEAVRFRKDGSPVFVSILAFPIKIHGKIIAQYGIYRDITELKNAEKAIKESEEKYRRLFEESKDGIFIITPDGNFIDANQACFEMFGFSSKEEFLKIDVKDIYVNPKDRDTYRKVLEEQGFVKDYELHLKRKDGREIIVLETSTAVKNEKGNIVAFRGIMRDVTQQRKLEEQLLQSQKMEAVGRLAGGIAHDFSNILTVIFGNAEMLIRNFDENSLEYKKIKQIIDFSRRATNLSKQLLVFSKRGIAQPVFLNINDVIIEMREMLLKLIGEDIEFKIELEPSLKHIKADRSWIDQVLINIIVNAREAMPKGGRITVKTENHFLDEIYCKIYPDLKPGEYILLSISDTGTGIPPEILPKIFEPFFSTKAEGTGLGLSTVYGIVKQLRGHISVYSELGKGTTFHIYLPVCFEEDEIDRERVIESEKLPSGKETILVVEDEKEILELLKEVLESLGYKIITASRREEAVMKVEGCEGKIDLLLTDVVLPGTSGPEIARELAEKFPEMKVLFMSGYTYEKIPLSEILEGRTNFISKPFSPFSIAKKIRDILDSVK